MDDARFRQALRRYWDEIARGGPATPGDLDPELAATIQRLHAMPDVPPDPSYARQLRESLMHATTVPIPLTMELPGNGRVAPLGQAGSIAPPFLPNRRQSWAFAQAALVLALIGALLAAYVTVSHREEPASFIPGVSTPVADDVQPGTWPMYRGSPARNGAMPGPGLSGPPAILWQFAAGASANFAAPIADGVIYLTTDDGHLYALDAATGAVRWQTDATFAMPSASGGVLYYVSADEALVARDLATEEELWRATPGSRFWTPLVAGDTVYYGAEANLLVARDARTGEERWVSEHTAPASRSVALADGILVVGSDDLNVYGVDQATGKTKWHYTLGSENATIQTPAIADGAVYVGTFGGDQNAFVGLDLQTGAERWRLEGVDGESFQTPAAADGLVFVTSSAGTLRALDAASGEVRWTYTATDEMRAGVAIVDGVVYAAGMDGIVRALDATSGTELWQLPLDGPIDFGPEVVDGHLYVGTGTGSYYAIGSADEVVGEATPAVINASPVEQGMPNGGPTGSLFDTTDATLTQVWARSTQQDEISKGLVGMAIDPFSRIWVCNSVEGTIELFDRDGNLLSQIPGGIGSAPGQWNWHIDTPNGGMWDSCGFAFAPDGTAYVTDVGNDRIQVLDPSGKVIESWSTEGDGTKQIFGPIAITRLSNGELVVIDNGPMDIARRFTADGTFLGYLETGAEIDVNSLDPTAILEDEDSNLWVLTWADGVIKLAPDGTLLQTIGGSGPGREPGQFTEPTDLALDEFGNVYVADEDNRRIQVFDASGTFLAQFTGQEAGITRFGDQGGGVPNLEYGGNGYLYVTDYSRDDFANGDERLMKFQVTLPSSAPAATPTT